MLSLNLNVEAQEFYSVIAENGLLIRSEPGLEADRIGKLSAGEDVEIIERTGKDLLIKEGDRNLRGEWFEIISEEDSTGYVFSGYLLAKETEDLYGCNDRIPCNTNISFESFQVIIYNYQTQSNITRKKDTIHTFEWGMNSIGDHLLHVIPNQDIDSMRVSFTVVETIEEQFNYKEQTWEGVDKWKKEQVRWKGHEPFVELQNHSNFFRIPQINYNEQEQFRQEKMNLRDTMVNLSGESQNIATLIYKEKACRYHIPTALIKVILYFPERPAETRFLEVELAYGC